MSGASALAPLSHGPPSRDGIPFRFTAKQWTAAATAAALAWAPKLLLAGAHPIARAVWCLGLYGVVYFGLTALLRVPETTALFRSITARLPGG
jgi:hypothetical protein